MANTVQFFGVEQVMDAADSLKQPAWAIFVGSSLFNKYQDTDLAESMDLLRQSLERLQMNDSAATYRIKFFESDGKPIKITEKSVCDAGSFTFKLTEPEVRQERTLAYSMGAVNDRLMKRLDELEKKFDQVVTEEVEEDNSLGGIVKGLLRNPGELAQLVSIGRVLLGKAPVTDLAAVGALPAPAAAAGDAAVIDQEEKLNRLGNAIDILEKADPKLIEHLEKLASMAQQQPHQFALTTSMLDQ